MITGAAQDIVLERIEPDPGQLSCPNQRVLYQCRVIVPSIGLTWTLPNGDGTLEFDTSSEVNSIHSLSSNEYTATLTSKTSAGTNRFFFTSILQTLESVNSTNLSCTGGTIGNAVEDIIAIILSGRYI